MPPAPPSDLRVAYVLSRFPKVTETFILYEVLELRRQGAEVLVHALVRERGGAVHPEARRLLPSVVFPGPARDVLAAQIHWLRRNPRTYLRLWLEAAGANLRSPRFLLRAIATVPLGAYFATRMARTGVQHVHAHWATHSALAGMVAARLLEVGFSFTAHAHDIYVDRTMLRRKIEMAAFVATISEFNERLLRSLYPAEVAGKLMVVHCGVDVDALMPPRREARADGALHVICVASLQPQKGHEVLVRAIAALRSRGIAARLSIVGDGPLAHRLAEEVASLRLDDRVTFLGALPRPDVIEQLRDADVMALASVPIDSGKMEGIPVALMEGMAMGLPVVGTSISGIPELIDDGVNGRLVPPGDADALADALAGLATDPRQRLAMGEAARRKIVDAFDLRASAAVLLREFRRAAESRAVGSAQGGGYRSTESQGKRDGHRQDDDRDD